MGSYVEHNRTTTTSTVCYSLCVGLFLLLLFVFFFVLFSFSSLTPSSYQRNNISFMATFERVKINNIYMRVCESDSFFLFFSFLLSFSKFDASVVFFSSPHIYLLRPGNIHINNQALTSLFLSSFFLFYYSDAKEREEEKNEVKNKERTNK